MPKTKTAKRYWRAKQVVVPRQVVVKQKHPVPDIGLVKDQKTSYYVCRKEDEHNKSRHMDLRTNDKKVADSWARAKGILEIERLTGVDNPRSGFSKEDVEELTRGMSVDEVLQSACMILLEY
jgi:hypothetical protein